MTYKKAKFQNDSLSQLDDDSSPGTLVEFFASLMQKLLVFNIALIKTMEALNYLWYMTTLLTDIHTTVTRLASRCFWS